MKIKLRDKRLTKPSFKLLLSHKETVIIKEALLNMLETYSASNTINDMLFDEDTFENISDLDDKVNSMHKKIHNYLVDTNPF